jgi:hypothetical protein
MGTTDEQYVKYFIEIQNKKLGWYWYWLNFPNSAIPIQNQNNQNPLQKTFQPK